LPAGKGPPPKRVWREGKGRATVGMTRPLKEKGSGVGVRLIRRKGQIAQQADLNQKETNFCGATGFREPKKETKRKKKGGKLRGTMENKKTI